MTSTGHETARRRTFAIISHPPGKISRRCAVEAGQLAGTARAARPRGIANAIAHATGKRLRDLPLTPERARRNSGYLISRR
jgi:CO/xanthine dehydrogenase Mo-binding subunit